MYILKFFSGFRKSLISTIIAVLIGLVPAYAQKALSPGRVVAIGGVFFKVNNVEEVSNWYKDHLGVEVGPGGSAHFLWRSSGEDSVDGRTVWTAHPRSTNYFGEGDQQIMINYIVDDLDALLEKLAHDGIDQVKPTEEYEYGRFAWVLDVEGNRIELWELPSF